ncbi:glycosidase [Halohasta litchfieldiae]|jgi:glycosidase|uniref:Glycosidase n=1 Tax=Halohasta litchfieldiae TaxID=1073996 RepID=A0A1H6SZV6_9EURY|nr:alpha-amylase MalA [Halohasta litchfieldiae]ATW86964.1 glycosidase [Halohasta litchfieldiae]SEI71404.1 Glycosidase [Halohasta litchfieldiae]
MDHPGPPQFIAVGDSLQLAPRDPDPEAEYEWTISEAPLASEASVGDEAVEQFVPDVPGRYTATLRTPSDRFDLTIRVFPSDRRPTGEGSGAGRSGMSGYSGMSGQSGSARPFESGGVSGSGSGSAALGQSSGDGEGRPRIRLDGEIVGDEAVITATVKTHPDSERDASELDVEFLLDDRDGVTESDVTIGDRELRIPLDAIGDEARVHAVAVGDSYSVADAVSVDRLGDEQIATDGGVAAADGGVAATGNFAVHRLNEPPQWGKEVTLYEIYVRGFAADDDEAETTFEALEKRLDYLEELGVDCLWLTPVLQHDGAPHGYNITDFLSIADDLGDREDYEAFVDAAHDRGMSILFDLVMNHSARDHPYFQDAYQNPASEYYDWYEWQDSGEPGTYFDWEFIANFDFTNLEVRQHLLQAVDTWAEVADGFRCDMAWAVPESFWKEMRERLKSKDPEFLLLDETIPYIADFHEGMFDIHFDTTLYFTLRQVGNGHQPAEAILDAVEGRKRSGFPDHAAFMLYLENHDETRYLVECGDEATKAAAGALFTLPGIPMLYGGQELGQRGKRDHLAWDHARDEIRSHYDNLIKLKENHPSLGQNGELLQINYEADDQDSVVAFGRKSDDGEYVVLLNFGEETTTVGIDKTVDATDLVSGDSVAAEDGLTVDDVVVVEVDE